MEATKTSDDHLIITSPDRYYSDSFKILLVDFEWGLAESIINPLRTSATKLAIHVYTPHDTDNKWLLDVSATCNIVLMDLNNTTNNDVIKGYLISKHNVWYTGRKDLKNIWTQHTDDPLSLLLLKINQYENEEINERRL